MGEYRRSCSYVIPDNSGVSEAVKLSQLNRKNVTPQTVESVTRVTARLRARWVGFRKIKIVQSTREIPDEFFFRALRKLLPIDHGTEGLYDPMTKTVYLISGNIASPERALWVAIHEVVGHAGIRTLGESVAKLIGYAAKNRFVAKLAMAIADFRGEKYEQRRHTDEAIAELAAAIITGDKYFIRLRYGVTVPTGMRNKRFAKVRMKLFKAVTDGDIFDMIDTARQRVEGQPDRLGMKCPRSGFGFCFSSPVRRRRLVARERRFRRALSESRAA